MARIALLVGLACSVGIARQAAAQPASSPSAAALLFSTVAFDPAPASAQSLDLGYAGTGISLGNSKNWTGLRINLRDHQAETLRGLNLTLWNPDDDAVDRLDGIALGLKTRGDKVNGL